MHMQMYFRSPKISLLLLDGLLLATERLVPPNYINIGSGDEISIKRLVKLIVKFTGFDGEVIFDTSKAGGDARRCVSVDKSRELIDFQPQVSIEDGLKRTIQWYQSKLIS